MGEQNDARRSFGVTFPRPAAFAAASTPRVATLRWFSAVPVREQRTRSSSSPRPAASSISGGGGTKRFRPVPTLGALAHHLEKVAQSLAVDVDLDVVAQRGGRVVEGDVECAELGAEVLR